MFRLDHAAFQDVQFIPTSPCERVLKNCNALINWNPDPPPPRAYVGQCGGFLWYLKAWLARGGGGFLRICLAYSWQSMEVGERGGDLTRA